MSKIARIGLIGAGAIGSHHAQNIARNISNAKLAAVADVKVEAAKKIASNLGVHDVSSDFRQILKDESIDAVVIAVPTFLKREILVESAEAGKQIFCEKPFTLRLADADEAIAAVSKSGVMLQMGFMRRFDASHVRAREAVSSGELGTVQMINSYGRDTSPGPGWATDPKRSGGIFFENLSHDFDAIRWIAQSEVTRVYAEGTVLSEKIRRAGDYENVVVTVKMEKGMIGTVDSSSTNSYGFDQHVDVLGTEGAVLMSAGTLSNSKIVKKDGIVNDMPHTYVERFAQAYRDEMIDFVNCVLNGHEPRSTGKDGRAAVEIGLAAWSSAKRNQPISLPLSPRDYIPF